MVKTTWVSPLADDADIRTQYFAGSYREDTCAGSELFEYMVNAVAFVISEVYMVAKLRSSYTGGSDVVTCSTIILSA